MPKIAHLRIIESDQTRLQSPSSLESDLAWVAKRGVEVERRLQDAAPEKDEIPSVDAPGTVFSESLPYIEVDGNLALSGRYPTREEMGIWMMFGFVSPEEKNAGGIRCCTL